MYTTRIERKNNIIIRFDKPQLEELKKFCLGALAKADKDGTYLPLWMHLTDAMYVIGYLYDEWIPMSIKAKWDLEINDSEFWLSLVLFCAGFHDDGKMTVRFAEMLKRETSVSVFHSLAGSFTGKKDLDGPRHDLAGEAILMSLTGKDSMLRGAASVIGSHHGVTYRSSDCRKSIRLHPESYFGTPDDSGCDYETKWKQSWKDTFECLKKMTGIKEEYESFMPHKEDWMLISGLVIMADWLASNTDYFPLIKSSEEDSAEQYPHRAISGLKQADIPAAWKQPALEIYFQAREAFFQSTFGFPPNHLQREVMKAAGTMKNGGLMIIEAGMGSGKTEASLAAVNCMMADQGGGGLFFGLPTQATANGLFSRITKWAEPQAEESVISIRLAHGKAALNAEFQNLVQDADKSAESARQGLQVIPWFSGSKKALLSDIVVGTIDQALAAVLRSRHAALRLIGLAGKVVVLDEIHGFDYYTSHYIERLLNWLGAYRTPVILLSATLPPGRRVQLLEAYLEGRSRKPSSQQEQIGDIVDSCQYCKKSRVLQEAPDIVKGNSYPLISWTVEDRIFGRTYSNDQTSLEVEFRHLRRCRSCGTSEQWFTPEPYLEEMAREALYLLEDGGCGLIIANEIRSAQIIYRYFQGLDTDIQLILYHSRFTDEDRKRIENKVLKVLDRNRTWESNERFLVIASPIAQESLDIDADFLMTQLCPGELLLQRLGRLHRNPTRIKPPRMQKALCYLYGNDEDEIDQPAEKDYFMYSPYLLWQTKQFLESQSQITLPNQIPLLMEYVYKAPDKSIDSSDKIQKYYEQHQRQDQKYFNESAEFLLPFPEERGSRLKKQQTLDDLYDQGTVDKSNSGSLIRRGLNSLDVLLVEQDENQNIFFLDRPDLNFETYKKEETDIDSNKLWEKLSMQRVSLPPAFSIGLRKTQALKDLEENQKQLPEWLVQISPAPMLILNSEKTAVLAETELKYSAQEGLYEVKKMNEET